MLVRSPTGVTCKGVLQLEATFTDGGGRGAAVAPPPRVCPPYVRAPPPPK